MEIKFEIINSLGEKQSLINSAFKNLVDITKIKTERAYNETVLNDFAFLQKNKNIELQTLQFESKSLFGEELRLFKKFILKDNETFTINILDSNDELLNFVYCKLSNYEFSQISATSLTKINLDFILISRYLKKKKYNLELSTSPTDKNYDFNYDFEYEGSGNTYLNSKLEFVNNGNYECKFEIEIIGETDNPKIALNSSYNNTHDACGLTISSGRASDVIMISSFSKNLGITKNNVSIEQNRDKTKKTFFTIPQGANILYFNNVSNANIFIIEESDDPTI